MTPNPLVTTFNNSVAVMAQDRISNPINPAFPDDIIIVDQQTALVYPDDMDDNLHPKQVGYEKMAGEWLNALTSSFLLYTSDAAAEEER